MKQQARKGIFETNSSNEYLLAVINLDKFKKWKNQWSVVESWTKGGWK